MCCLDFDLTWKPKREGSRESCGSWRDAKALQEKNAKKAAQAAGGDAGGVDNGQDKGYRHPNGQAKGKGKTRLGNRTGYDLFFSMTLRLSGQNTYKEISEEQVENPNSWSKTSTTKGMST
ncbi:hypothetical protein QQ045_028195 [Rhodiola kirilowii]